MGSASRVESNNYDYYFKVLLIGDSGVGKMMQSYTPRALNRRLQEDWTKDAREGPRVLMNLRVDFGPMG